MQCLFGLFQNPVSWNIYIYIVYICVFLNKYKADLNNYDYMSAGRFCM